MQTLLGVFNEGMDRLLPEFDLPPDDYPALILGSGTKHLERPNGAINLDRTSGWRAPMLPYEDECIGEVVAYHFLEHLDGMMVIAQLREIERVLVPGGIFNSVIPHWSCELAYQDLDHKSFWSETTWKNLLANQYYADRPAEGWKLKVRSCCILGIVSRNLVIVSQLVKAFSPVPTPKHEAEIEIEEIPVT